MSDIVWQPITVTLSVLQPWPRNPRRMSKKQAERLLKSFDDLGQFQTIAVGPGGEVYDGHQRLAALLKVHGPGYEVRALQSSRPLTEAEREQLTILSQTASGSWDWDALASWDAGLLQGLGFDADLLAGWNDDAAQLRTLLESEAAPVIEDAGPQVDKAEELQAKWQVSAGDIYQAGEHFVICGDCREATTWERLLAAAGVEKVNGVFTSPPYAMQRKEQYGGVETAEYVEWWEAVQGCVKANLAGDGSFFVNIKPHCEDGQRVLYVFDLVLAMVRRWGWRFEDEFCWIHTSVPKRVERKFKNGFEPVYHFSLEYDFKFSPNAVMHNSNSIPVWDKDNGVGGASNWGDATGGRGDVLSGKTKSGLAYPSNTISVSGGNAYAHAAAFPVTLPAFFIKAYSDKGDVWLDPFLGSGTTIVAAHQNGRRGLGIERLEKYVAVTLERLAALGLEPRKVQDGPSV